MRSILGLSIVSMLCGALAKAPELSDICPYVRSAAPKNPACPSPEFLRKTIASDLLMDEGHWDLPGWKGPEKCIHGMCVLTKNNVGGGPAIVMITSKRWAERVASFHFEPMVDIYPPPYYSTDVPGKGIGLVANRTISKGEIIFAHPPTMIVQRMPLYNMGHKPRDELYSLAVERLPESRRASFKSQIGRDLAQKIDVNSFDVHLGEESSPDEYHVGVYPEIARINHDCRPNVHYHIDNAIHTVVALRDIAPGEELSLTYIDLLLTHQDRRSRLKKWGFDCNCKLCTQGAAAVKVSDDRIRRIATFKADLDNFNAEVVRADTGARLVEMYEAEGLDCYLGAALTRAALTFAIFDQTEKAVEYAKRAVDQLDLENGVGGAEAAAMKVLADRPWEHWTWDIHYDPAAAASNKAKSKVNSTAQKKS